MQNEFGHKIQCSNRGCHIAMKTEIKAKEAQQGMLCFWVCTTMKVALYGLLNNEGSMEPLDFVTMS